MDINRIALVWSASGSVGSGYAVGRRLVLTARHVVGSSKQTEVWLAGSRQTWHAKVEWRSDSEVDACLLQLGDPVIATTAFDVNPSRALEAINPPVGFARFSRLAAIDWECSGFPRAVANAKTRQRESVGGHGALTTGGGLAQRLLELAIAGGPTSSEGWQGLSGAAVLVRGRLIGILREVPLQLSGRLWATPFERVLEVLPQVWKEMLGGFAEELLPLPASALSVQDQLLAMMSLEKGVPVAPLEAILRRLGEAAVPVEQLAQRLSEKADELLALRQRWQGLALPEVSDVRARALQRLEQGDLEGARTLLRELREKMQERREKQAQEEALRHERQAREEALLVSDEARLEHLELRYHDAASKYGQAAELVAFSADEHAAYIVEQGLSLYARGREFGDNDGLKAAVHCFSTALVVQTRERAPFEWAATQTKLGKALSELGERELGTQRLEEAVAAFHAALQERSRERTPLEWAMTQNHLATALARLSKRETGTQRLVGAVAAYREALQEQTRERVPLEWARIQGNLGVALSLFGERESGTEHLEQAVVAYREALQEQTRERVPLEWARVQSNLGGVLWMLGARTRSATRLVEAVAVFRAALQEQTRERVPLDWARTQSNLGNALQALGEGERDTTRLGEAVAAYGEALQEQTRERMPLLWAETQNNLGLALLALGERKNSTPLVEEAVVAFRAALQEQTRDGVPLDWARTQNNLGKALWTLGDRGSSLEIFGDAANALNASLAVLEVILGTGHPQAHAIRRAILIIESRAARLRQIQSSDRDR